MFDLHDLGDERIRPLNRSEYHRLGELGFFEGERVELLEGLLVSMSPQSAAHARAIVRLTRILARALEGRVDLELRPQLPLAASPQSEPEPDFAITAASDDESDHPPTALLAIEVSASSLTKDRVVKSRVYAAANIAEYWIVDLAARRVEVQLGPEGRRYSRQESFGEADTITSVSTGITVSLRDVFSTK